MLLLHLQFLTLSPKYLICHMEMKTCITIILLLLMLVSSCPYVLSCRVKVRTPDFKQLEGAASNALQKGIQSMGQQMQRFTDNGIQLLQTMGTSVSQFLSEISDTTEKGIETIGKQVEGIRTDTNRQLENIVNDVNRTLGELVLRVDKVGEAINKNIMPPLTSILNNANVIVKKAHTVVDIWIVLLLLFGFFVSRYLRLLTGNDFVSLCEYVILSFSELILLNGAVIVLIVTLHKFIVSEDDEKKILDEMSPEDGVQNERLLKFMVILNVLIIVIFGTLRLVRKIDVKAVLAIFFWPLQKKISVGLHSQKRHRLAASCGLYRLAASCQQVAASLLTSSSCSKSVKSALLQLDICRLAASCCNNLHQACG